MNHSVLNLNTDRSYQAFHHHDDGTSRPQVRQRGGHGWCKPRYMSKGSAPEPFCRSTAATSIHATPIGTPRATTDTTTVTAPNDCSQSWCGFDPACATSAAPRQPTGDAIFQPLQPCRQHEGAGFLLRLPRRQYARRKLLLIPGV